MMAHPVVRGDEHDGVPQSSRNDFFMFSHEVRYGYVFKLLAIQNLLWQAVVLRPAHMTIVDVDAR